VWLHKTNVSLIKMAGSPAHYLKGSFAHNEIHSLPSKMHCVLSNRKKDTKKESNMSEFTAYCFKTYVATVHVFARVLCMLYVRTFHRVCPLADSYQLLAFVKKKKLSASNELCKIQIRLKL